MEIYSKRDKNYNGPYKTDLIPTKLINQILHIWMNFFTENYIPGKVQEIVWKRIHDFIADEHGEKRLEIHSMVGGKEYSYYQRVSHYFEYSADVDKSIDVIETCFRFFGNVENFLKNNFQYEYKEFTYTITDAISDLNKRFKENSIGFEFINNRIIKIDNDLLHHNTVDEVIQLLTDKDYENANEEFMNALIHYKNSLFKECLNECLKSLETTLKIICNKNSWPFNADKDSASDLIKVCIGNGLFPKYLLDHFSGIRSVLNSGVPTIRNKTVDMVKDYRRKLFLIT